MHRDLLLQKLQTYIPSEHEVEFKQRMIAFVQQYPDCFERSLRTGHVTASVWLLDKTGTKALLMHHAKLDRWLQLGGHCDGDADVLRVAIKEAQEESGIMDIVPVSEEIFDIDIHRIPGNAKEPEHDHYDVRFLLQVMSDEAYICNSESKALMWVDKKPDALPTQHPALVRMFQKWALK